MKPSRPLIGGSSAQCMLPGVPRVIFVLARSVSVLCLVVLGVVAVFDARAERFTVVDVASRQPGTEASPGHRSALRDDPWTSL